MAYLTSQYVYDVMGEALVRALFTDDDPGTGAKIFQSDALARVIAKSDARVMAALRTAGYDPPETLDSVTDAEADTLQSIAFGAFAITAANRKQMDLPPDYRDDFRRIQQIEDGTIRFPSISLVRRAAVGGVKFGTATKGAKPVFSRDMGR